MTAEKRREYEKERAGLRLVWRSRQDFSRSVSRSAKSEISLLVNRQSLVNTTLQDFVAERAEFQRAAVSKAEINGIKFLVLSGKDNEKYCFTVRNEYFLEICLKYENEADLNLPEESLKTLMVIK